MIKRYGPFLLLFLWLTACQPQATLPTRVPTSIWPTEPASIAVEPTAVAQPNQQPTTTNPTAVPPSPIAPTFITVAADTAVPPDLVQAAQQLAQETDSPYRWSEAAEADLRLSVGSGQPISQWLYAAIAPFATLRDQISSAELLALWQGQTEQPPLFVSPATAVAFTWLWGQPGPAVHIVAEAELSTQLWQQRPSYGLLPFHQLTPDLKLLAVDGQSPLAHDFVPQTYPLQLQIGLVGDSQTAVDRFLRQWDGPSSNRQADKLSRIAVTGVTAFVRATAYNMEQYGILWPGEEVAPVLQQADIAHMSNEVSFAADCPYPNPIGGTTFCSSDAYFALIEHLGIDVMELTGNHLNDWGLANTERTLALYEAAGLQLFGGGANLEEAAQPALFEHHGNRIAFVGCNSLGPVYAWATETAAGAMPCDGSLAGQIEQLRQEGYLVWVMLQYTEYYQYAAPADQVAFFQAMAAAGATAVSGSQGHHAQGFAFDNGAFIHYGLGNLFFDQMDMLGTRQTFVDTYVVYDGRLLSVELWTGLIENYARPRLMDASERQALLTAVFLASGWPTNE